MGGANKYLNLVRNNLGIATILAVHCHNLDAPPMYPVLARLLFHPKLHLLSKMLSGITKCNCTVIPTIIAHAAML